ncbi:hypothetical protein C8R42DRAFT_708187 [Lentinula raphanica]|nr:hypothetical protein C8R42DRAFT_708187 [Lentinula raphanica]
MELTKESKDWKHIVLTQIKEAEDGSNNYNEFKRKSMFELDAAGYWKFIDGPDYNPPQIPVLQPTREMQGLDLAGNPSTFRIPGNKAEVQAAREKAKTWLDGDKKALAIIVKSVPVEKLHILEDCTSAHAAWKALKSEYEPTNTLSALTIMQQIIGNQCKPDDDPVAWLDVMIRLLRIAEVAGRTFSSQTVIRRLKDEEVELGIAPYVTSLNMIVATSKGKSINRDNHHAVPGVYSANKTRETIGDSNLILIKDLVIVPLPLIPTCFATIPSVCSRKDTRLTPVLSMEVERLVNIQATTMVRETYTFLQMIELLHDEGKCWKKREEADQQVEEIVSQEVEIVSQVLA